MLTVEDFALIEKFCAPAGNVMSPDNPDNARLRQVTNQRRSMLINSWVRCKGSEVAQFGVEENMNRVLLVILLLSGFAVAQERAPVKCTEDSPERRGEEGCTILASRPFAGPLPKTVYWHIDRFDSLEHARAKAGVNGVATAAHGGFWLMTVEGKTNDHHGGGHVEWIGPLVLPSAAGYTMNVRSTLLKSGAETPVHIHSGPEVFYIVLGEQCLETQKVGHRLRAGKFLILPTDQIHRGRVQKSGMRGALILVLHDAGRPASTDLNDPPPLIPCK